MDWSTITPLIANAAPTIGSLLGGLIPFPGGAVLGQVAGKVVAEALGVPPTPEAVKEAIETRDPVVVNAQLSTAESQMQLELEKHKADLLDTQDARATTVKLAHLDSPIAWGAPVVSVLVVAGFFVITGFFMTMLFYVKEDIPSNVMLLMSAQFGALQLAVGQVVNYWLGSSAGSKDKTNAIQSMIANGVASSKKVN